MAGRLPAKQLKWVRFPPASLTDQLPVWTTSFCERERCLNYTFVGRSQYKPNCLLGVHDGPKVAMPGDRLVNGAEVSRRRRGQSTVGDSPIRTAVANATSWQPFVGQQHNGDCRIGVHGSIPTASAYEHSGGGAHLGAGNSDQPSSPTTHDRLPDWSTWLITRGLWVGIPPAQLADAAP